MKLIVGLGNPGNQYLDTRHNVGFQFLDYYKEYCSNSSKWISKWEALYYDTNINGEKVIFLKPQTYMNLSGDSVIKVMNYFSISIDDILIISDDLDLIVGNFKLKANGSSGGHNGLKSIGECIGSFEFKRLKIGISKNKDYDTKDYVLGKLSKDEKNAIIDVYKELCLVVDDFFKLPFSDLMSKYNRKNR